MSPPIERPIKPPIPRWNKVIFLINSNNPASQINKAIGIPKASDIFSLGNSSLIKYKRVIGKVIGKDKIPPEINPITLNKFFST